MKAPRASGSACGVRSPWRYGWKSSPSTPGSQLGGLAEQLLVGWVAERAVEPIQRACGREHHAHRVPGSRNGVAEGVQPRLRLGPVLVERGEDDTGRAEHDRERPRRSNADAERPRRLVARARDLRRFVHRRQPLARKLERVEQLVAPASVRNVEEKRPGRIRDVDGVLAGEAEAHVVLWQEDVTDAGVGLGLVPAEPEELRRREAGEGAISGQLEQPVEAEPLLDLGAFRAGALVVPEDRGAKHVTVLVEDDEAVHLAREAERAVVPELAERRLRSPPPVVGILFGPARSRRRERIGALGAGERPRRWERARAP